MESIAWDDDVPEVPAARLWTPPDGTTKLLLLGPPLCCWTHWTGKRTVPCQKEHCPRPLHRRPIKWYAYYPAVLYEVVLAERQKWVAKRKVVFGGTSVFASKIREHGSYRGLLVTILKQPKRNDYFLEQIVRVDYGDDPLYDLFNVSTVLFNAWGIRPPKISDDPPVEHEG